MRSSDPRLRASFGALRRLSMLPAVTRTKRSEDNEKSATGSYPVAMSKADTPPIPYLLDRGGRASLCRHPPPFCRPPL